jgi:hypothetical protein
MKKLGFIYCCSALVLGLTSISVALGAVSEPSDIVTDDTALYQRLSEIKAKRQERPNFDGDIDRLAGLEPRYRENLPSLARNPRLQGPMKRISTQQYRYSGARKKSVVRN